MIDVKMNIEQVLMMIVWAETPADLDAISKWLDIAGNKLDYRRYGEVQLRVKQFSISNKKKSWPPPYMFLDHHHDSNYMLFHHDESNNLQALLEILIAGGLLAPGGSIQQDGEKGPVSTSACIFQVVDTVLDGNLSTPYDSGR